MATSNKPMCEMSVCRKSEDKTRILNGEFCTLPSVLFARGYSRLFYGAEFRMRTIRKICLSNVSVLLRFFKKWRISKY